MSVLRDEHPARRQALSPLHVTARRLNLSLRLADRVFYFTASETTSAFNRTELLRAMLHRLAASGFARDFAHGATERGQRIVTLALEDLYEE